MEIIRGKLETAQKVIVYGPEGIGKSTFASQFPEPVFIDTEGSTKHLDVARLPKPSSWAMLLEEAREIKNGAAACKTLVLDTADWAEQLCINHICTKAQKTGIADFGYGKGYVYVAEEFGRLLNLMEEIIERGVNVVITAHAKMRKFEQPDEMGTYDRWEMKLSQKTAPMLKEWADMVLFANYKIVTVRTETKKTKAQGGARVMYTAHHPCWDAKNRHGLTAELPFDYLEIAHCIPAAADGKPGPVRKPQKADEPKPAPAPEPAKRAEAGNPVSEPAAENLKAKEADGDFARNIPEDIPKALRDLMIENRVFPAEIQRAVYENGHFPIDTPISNYPTDYIEGVLVAAWPKVYAKVFNNRDLPF